MKRLLLALCLLSIGFLGGYLCRDGSIPAARANERSKWTPEFNGDVDGNGDLDITDAIYILDFCFRGGPPPVRLATVRRGLPVTGQIHCWSGTRGELQDPCPEPGMDDYGQDANYPDVGFPHEFELVKPDEKDPLTWYTIDHGTGLMWQYRDDERLNWRDALRHIENLELGGFDDWRMPNIQELFSIVDVSVHQPAVDRDFFFVRSANYWSSSTCVYDASRAYAVRFNYGLVNCPDKGGQGQSAFRLYSLAVRSME